MAENNLEITYIPYGLDEISQLDLMTNLANGVEGYLGSRRWARKDKYRNAWLAAYLDIINHGLTGASNDSGVWTINHGQEAIPLDTKSNLEKEMYQDAAYYIQLQMAKMTPRKKEEEKKKENLTPFKFKESFGQLLLNNKFGGDSSLFEDPEQGWNALDARGADGLRGTTERRRIMAELLKLYKKELEGKDYNFEGTSFKDKLDALDKIQAAIDALGTDKESDDIPAFNALGLNYRGFFSNGGNEASTHLDSNGNPYTYNLWNQLQLQLAEAKTKLEAEKLKQQRANQYSNYKIYNFGLNGTPLTQETSKIILNKLTNGLDLDGNDLSGITWAFKLGIKNGGLQNLSKEELLKFGPRYSGTPGRLKKLQGLDGIYYDSIANRIIRPYQNNLQLFGITLEDIINQNSPEAIAKKQLEKIQLANNRKLSEGFLAEDYLRMGAMALDITGAVAAWVPTYGTAISGGLGLSSLATNFAADWNDDSVTVGDMFKNAGINLALAGVGMVPGLGLAAKSGKWLANIAKWTPRILTLASAGHIALSDDIKNSLKKASSISDWNQLTNQDVKNITYALSTVAGLSRGVKGIVNDRKFKPTVTQETQTETYITTKSGKQIKATKEQVEAINKAGRKGGNDKANEELRKLPGALNEEVNIKFKTGIKGKADPTNRVKLESSTKNIGQSPEVERYSRALSIKNIRDKAKHPLLSKYLLTDYDIYLGAAKVSIPNINVVDRFKQIWNPVSNRPFKPFKGTKQNNNSQNSSNSSNSSNSGTGSNAKPKLSILSKKDSNELLSTLRGKNFSTNEFKDESRVIGSVKGFGDLYGIRNSDGTHTLLIDFGGTRVNVTGTKADIKGKTLEVLRKDVMKKIDSLVPKEQRSRIKFDLIKQLKLNGYLRYGGQINPSLDKIIEDFIKNNNI